MCSSLFQLIRLNTNIIIIINKVLLIIAINKLCVNETVLSLLFFLSFTLSAVSDVFTVFSVINVYVLYYIINSLSNV